MRVALLGTRGYPSTYGGFETLIRHLGPYLRDRGHEVTVYGREGRPGEDVVDGIRRVTTRGVESKSASTLTFGATAIAHAAREQYDAAFVANVAHGYYLPLLRSRRVPTVVNVDGIEWERDKWGAAAKRVFRTGALLTNRWADHLVTDARAISRYWKAEFDRDSTFIPYGAPVVDSAPPTAPDELGLQSRGYALVVARLVPENNVETILDAFATTDAVPLVVVGSANYDSPLATRLEHLAAARPDVHALGHVHDQTFLQSLWSHAACVVHGHSVGGTNPALLQAMGSGTAVLAFDTVYNREVLGETGRYWQDASRLRDAVAEVRDDVGLRDRLGRAAQERVRTAYAWDDVCARYEHLLVRAADARWAPVAA